MAAYGQLARLIDTRNSLEKSLGEDHEAVILNRYRESVSGIFLCACELSFAAGQTSKTRK